MSDDGEMGTQGNAGATTSPLAPGVLVRLQYAAYLFVGLVMCLMLKGTAGRAFDGVSALRSGCEFLAKPSLFPSSLTTPSPAPSGGGGSDSVLLNAVCYGNTLVYRVSFTLTMFFLIHFASVSDLTCCVDANSRAQFQERFFCVKTALVTLLFFISFSIPNSFFAVYAWICMFVSAIFLVIQMILMVDFSYQWNDEWGARVDSNGKWQWYLLFVALGSFALGLTICIVGYVYLVPHEDCNFNAFAITMVLVFGFLSTVVAVWVPHGSIVPSGIVFAYCAILQFSNLRSTPDPYCNAFTTSDSDLKSTVLAALFSGCLLAYSVVSAGGSRSSLSLDGGGGGEPIEDADESGHLSSYCFFHAIMMAGSMYLAMLATNWSVSGSEGGNSSSTTAVSFWVKNASVWLTMFLYMWSLLAPYFCCKERDFGFQTDDW